MASCLRWLTFWSHSKHQSNSEDLNWAQLSCYLSLHHLLLNIKVITMQYDYCQGNASEANTKGYLSASLNRVLYPRYWRPFISLNTAGFQGFYGLNEEIQLPHWRWTNMCGLGWCRVVILYFCYVIFTKKELLFVLFLPKIWRNVLPSQRPLVKVNMTVSGTIDGLDLTSNWEAYTHTEQPLQNLWACISAQDWAWCCLTGQHTDQHTLRT